MERYVVGFLFDGKGNVALIHKTHPKWQKDRLNGVGGHIEGNETPEQAMKREFEEEAGCSLNWREYCLIYGDEYELHCLTTKQDCEIKSLTDEIVAWYPMNRLDYFNVIPNLMWLVPMANYKNEIKATVYHKSPEC